MSRINGHITKIMPVALLLITCFVATGSSAQETLAVPLNDSISISFTRIPAGTFLLGSSENDPHAQGDEFPRHQVTLSEDYYLGQFEVTQEQWEAVMGYNPSVFRHPQRPVDMVSWNDCRRFLEKLNARGLGAFRLPTEAEWERAAKLGGEEFRDEEGNVVPWKLRQYAWFNSRSEGKSHPVGTKAASAIGLYDMMGNVWEWCSDWNGPYPEEARTDPTGPASGARRIYKGGSWFNEPEALRPANRHKHPPDIPFTNAGFRLLMEIN